MTLDVVMHQSGYERVKERLEALALDLRPLPLQNDGTCLVDGVATPLAELKPEAVWLSLDVAQSGRFDACLAAIPKLGSVKWLQTFNAGLDHPGYRAIADAGIRIGASSAQAVAISEYTFAHVLSLYQPIDAQRALQAEREWKRLPFRELSRSTWVVVGFGNIGREVAHRAKAFGARVLAVRRTPSASPLADETGAPAALPGYLAEADVVVLSCPHTRETDRMVDRAFFAALKPGAILVNVARGGLIDDDALLAALDSGAVSTAVLDVFEPEPLSRTNPLWQVPNLLITPHVSADDLESYMPRTLDLGLDNIARLLDGRPLRNRVRPKLGY